MDETANDLIKAAMDGDSMRVRQLLKPQRRLFWQHDINERFKDLNALDWAACRGYATIVGLLLNAGAEINAQSNKGITALHWACSQEDLAVVELLLKHHAKVDITENDGRTAFHFAMARKTPKIAAALAAAGAHVPAEFMDVITAPEIVEAFSRRLADELSRPGRNLQNLIITRDGALTENGLDYACAGVVQQLFEPRFWRGRETQGLEFGETLLKAAPGLLRQTLHEGLDLSELRRNSISRQGKKAVLKRFHHPQNNAWKR